MPNKISGTIKFVKKDNRGFQLAEDGEWYSMYRGTLPNRVNKGDKVEVTFEINGQYRNIKDMKVTETNVNATSGSSSYSSNPETVLMNGIFALSCKFIEMETASRENGKTTDADLPAFINLITGEILKSYFSVKKALSTGTVEEQNSIVANPELDEPVQDY